MKNEAEFKSAFKKSVKAQGGFAISLAAPMLAGLPDLYVIMPGFMPVLLEAKWFGEVTNGFKRKIPYTKMQEFYIKECNKIRPYSALGLVGFKQKNTYWAALIGHNNDGYISDMTNFTYWNHVVMVAASKKSFDILDAFSIIGVPKLNGMGAHASI